MPDVERSTRFHDFYSRPCGRGDEYDEHFGDDEDAYFYSRPCGRGDELEVVSSLEETEHFYSRPCGRGDMWAAMAVAVTYFISTHAPAGGATRSPSRQSRNTDIFLLTPLREGRLGRHHQARRLRPLDFYSRPCGRGDGNFPQVRHEVLRQIAER